METATNEKLEKIVVEENDNEALKPNEGQRTNQKTKTLAYIAIVLGLIVTAIVLAYVLLSWDNDPEKVLIPYNGNSTFCMGAVGKVELLCAAAGKDFIDDSERAYALVSCSDARALVWDLKGEDILELAEEQNIKDASEIFYFVDKEVNEGHRHLGKSTKKKKSRKLRKKRRKMRQRTAGAETDTEEVLTLSVDQYCVSVSEIPPAEGKCVVLGTCEKEDMVKQSWSTLPLTT